MPKEIADEAERQRQRTQQTTDDNRDREGAGGATDDDEGATDDEDPAEQLGGDEGDGQQVDLDDEGEGEGEGGDEVEGERRQPSRRENRVARLAADRAAEKARADALEAELTRFRNAETQRNTQLTEEQETARLALMSPEERMEYKLSKSERLAAAREANLRRDIAIGQDAAAFNAKAEINPIYKRMQPIVEAEFQKLLRAGTPADRETIMKYKLGERMLEDASKRGGKVRDAGRERVERETTRPTNGRGGQPSQRGRQVDESAARRKRLEKLTF